MSKKEVTLVYYYVPEDYDDPETLNVFSIPVGKNNIKLHHIYEAFPLKGQYIFRFKVMYDSAIAWLDLPELDSKLPTFKDKIMIKATRISWEPDNHHPYGHYRINKAQYQATTPQNKIPQRVEKTQEPPIKTTKVSAETKPPAK